MLLLLTTACGSLVQPALRLCLSFALLLTSMIGLVAANQPPVIEFPTPAGTYFGAADVWVIAFASDADGTVTTVEFIENGTVLNTQNDDPRSFVRNFAVGTHVLTAKATDNLGATTTSAPVTLVINPANGNPPPTVSLTSGGGAALTAPASITLTASASDSNGSVAKVEFWSNGFTLLGTATSAPYSLTLNNLPAGAYDITARATDNQGAIATSTTIGKYIFQPAAGQPPLTGPGIPKRTYNASQVYNGELSRITASTGYSHGKACMIDGYLFVPVFKDQAPGGGGIDVYDLGDPTAPVRRGKIWTCDIHV